MPYILLNYFNNNIILYKIFTQISNLQQHRSKIRIVNFDKKNKNTINTTTTYKKLYDVH